MSVSVIRTVAAVRAALIAQCASLLVACGSGGGGEPAAVLPPVPVAPAVSTQPASVSVALGQPATFSVVATGTSPSYQWSRAVGTAAPAPIAGATGATYTVTQAACGDNAVRFTVTVANASGSVTSSEATLSVSPACVAPSLTRAPVTASVLAGATASFDVAATGSAPLTYQWFRGGAPISGATQVGYSLVTAVADNNALFTVTVTNPVGSVTSAPAPLRVTTAFVPVGFAAQPQDVSVRAGQEATFTVTLTGTGPFTWRWFRNGVDTGLGVADTFVNTPSYIFTPAVLADNGSVMSIRVTDSSGTITSRQALLTVLP
jgi:hypothetical protein